MKQTFIDFKSWTIKGLGLSLGLFMGYLFAVSVGNLNTFSSGATVSSSEINSNFTTLKTAIESLNMEVQTNLASINSQNNSLIPVGTILPYAAASVPPTGFLLCDGSAVSRTTYASLFAVLGTTLGSGDGSTTFNLPDTKAAMPVGAGTSTRFTQNVTRTIGQYSNDQLQGFEKYLFRPGTQQLYLVADFQAGTGGMFSGGPFVGANTIRHQTKDFISDGFNGTPRIGNETHGKQFAVHFIIKY
ncbi:MAG: phage tail protein [Spirochaetota bacterium]